MNFAKKLMRNVLVLMGATFVVLFTSIAVRTAASGSAKSNVTGLPDAVIPDGAAERLAGSIRIPTISMQDSSAPSAPAFRAMHAYLEKNFPQVHKQLLRETVNTHSLLYTWQGTDPTLNPILLVGHLDVVPVESGTEQNWSEDPFSGRVSEGYIWGRGAIDNKSAVLGMLEAIEMLVKDGFQPERTIYLAFGHDEEVGGTQGAQEIAALLKQRDIELEMVLDEGGVISDGALPGVAAPVALVGIAEKGFVSIELNVHGSGGHSSMPPAQSSVGILSSAITRLEENQMPARLDGATGQMFRRLRPQFALMQRAVFENLWLTRPLVLSKLESSPTTNAMVRTTTAATVFQAGAKENVLPANARAVINYRILPGDSVADVVSHVRRVIADDRVLVSTTSGFVAEPSAVSSPASESFQRLERAIVSVVPDATVAPFLVLVVTDSRYYAGLSDNIYRFQPVRVSSGDLQRMHGTDERISVRDHERAIRVYRQVFLEVAGK